MRIEHTGPIVCQLANKYQLTNFVMATTVIKQIGRTFRSQVAGASEWSKSRLLLLERVNNRLALLEEC